MLSICLLALALLPDAHQLLDDRLHFLVHSGEIQTNFLKQNSWIVLFKHLQLAFDVREIFSLKRVWSKWMQFDLKILQ